MGANTVIDLRFVAIATSGFNETVEVNRTTWSTFDVTRAHGRNGTQPYTFRINDTGLWKVPCLLFKDGGSLSASLAPVGFGNQKAVFIDGPRFEVEQRRKGIRERVNTSPAQGPRPGQTPCDCG